MSNFVTSNHSFLATMENCLMNKATLSINKLCSITSLSSFLDLALNTSLSFSGKASKTLSHERL